MRKTVTGLISAILVASCDLSAGADELKSGDTQLISIVEKSEKVEDPESPVGYWEITKQFPQVANSHDQAKTVNGLINQLVEKYSCNGTGDETFTAELTYSSQDVLSFRYETMWLCPPMLSPESAEGTLTVDLTSGRKLDIDSEFASEDDRKTVMSRVRKGIGDNITSLEKANGIRCGNKSSVDDFYITESDIVFLHTAKTHDEVTCSTAFHFGKEEISDYLKTGSRLLN
ncbi:hypothetical protein [Microbulbifer thermotolerans]|uniref:hypothetical protein n=1 Tax=Microbulbifer thermotolerans TaxID=252514 RepID=UPI00224AD78D|nr:hypothetical protein [Microbulbifer thermotolerans]MCX2781042.1 hypothetical protein [Microbulbifer thermotolerans]MCX2804563.1 hypothetical protein [Microbulbifer thermotolerans]